MVKLFVKNAHTNVRHVAIKKLVNHAQIIHLEILIVIVLVFQVIMIVANKIVNNVL